MADQRNGGIAWTDETWNPILGCSKVSSGCDHCYAEAMAARFCKPWQPYSGLIASGRWNGRVHVVEERLRDPIRRKKPRKIFVNSMSDLFHGEIDEDTIDRIFAVMAICRHHTFQILTKRPHRMFEYLAGYGRLDNIYDCWHEFSGGPMEAEAWPLPNVWLGVTAENQQTADERIPLLLQTPAAVRFVSVEPMLGPVDLRPYLHRGLLADPSEIGKFRDPVDWVICGGESGPGARPMHQDWARGLRDQCQVARVPFLFKQWGEWLHQDQWPDTAVEIDPDEWMHATRGEYGQTRRIGKKVAGRRLDGREWNEFPEVKS